MNDTALYLRLQGDILDALAQDDGSMEDPLARQAAVAARAALDALQDPRREDEYVLIAVRVVRSLWSAAKQVVVPTVDYLRRSGLICEEDLR